VCLVFHSSIEMTTARSARGRVADEHYGAFHALWREGATKSSIAAQFKVSRTTVTRWLDRAQCPSVVSREHDFTKAKDRFRIAKRRKAVQSLIQETCVETRQKKSPIRRKVTSRQVVVMKYPSAPAVARQLGNVSAKTVVRDLKAMGFKLFSQPSGPLLTEKGRVARVLFCRRVLRMSKENRRKILFSDEKWFDSQTKRFTKVWTLDPRLLPARFTTQGGPKLLVLGFISDKTKALDVCKVKTMDNHVYEEFLTKRRAMLQAHIFQQDNARPHAALVNRGWFKRHNIELLGWPAYSPDLNVIETLWAWLGRAVKDRAPFGEVELESFVREEFRKIKQDQVRKLVDEFDDRLRLCIELQGGLVTKTLLRQFRRRVTNGKRGKARRS